MRKIGTSFRKPSRQITRLYYCVLMSSSVNLPQGGSPPALDEAADDESKRADDGGRPRPQLLVGDAAREEAGDAVDVEAQRADEVGGEADDGGGGGGLGDATPPSLGHFSWSLLIKVR